MELWLVLTLGLIWHQTDSVYGIELSLNGSNYSDGKIGGRFSEEDIRVLIQAYKNGKFQVYGGEVKYYHHGGRNYYLNHTGDQPIENDPELRLCTFSTSAIDELTAKEDMWNFEAIKFYCPRKMICCDLTCCKKGMPWWITLTIVTICVILLAAIIYGVGRGFRVYEKRRSYHVRKDTIQSIEEKHMLDPR